MKKKILFISATHGNEGYSIKILDEIEKQYPRKKYKFERVIGNPMALKVNKRYLDVNLNRSAPGNKNSRLYEEKRAFEIMKIAKRFDYIIDLHGSDSDCGIVMIICNPTLQNFVLAGMLNIKKIVIWRTLEDLKKGPLTQSCKPAGLEIECGNKNNLNIQKKLKIILQDFIKNYQKITIIKIMKNIEKKQIYVIYDKLAKFNKKLNDFEKTKKGREIFYPFMSNVYPDTACYKMKKINLPELFLSQSKI